MSEWLAMSLAPPKGLSVQIEVLCVDRRSEGTYRLARSAPESWNHIHGEGKRAQTQHDAGHGHRLVYLASDGVHLELQLTDEVETQGGEDDYPERQEHLAVQDVPAVSQVGYREELQRERQFDESQYDLDGFHP